MNLPHRKACLPMGRFLLDAESTHQRADHPGTAAICVVHPLRNCHKALSTGRPSGLRIMLTVDHTEDESQSPINGQTIRTATLESRVLPGFPAPKRCTTRMASQKILSASTKNQVFHVFKPLHLGEPPQKRVTIHLRNPSQNVAGFGRGVDFTTPLRGTSTQASGMPAACFSRHLGQGALNLLPPDKPRSPARGHRRSCCARLPFPGRRRASYLGATCPPGLPGKSSRAGR